MKGSGWHVLGESVAVWLTAPEDAFTLPDGIHALGGRMLLAASRFEDSSAGPFSEVAVLLPARMGLRVGLTAVLVVVDSPRARLDAETSWGSPAVLGHLGWHATARHRRIVWEDRSLDLVATLERPARLPMVAPARVLQHRRDGNVVANGWARGHRWRARILVNMSANDPLASIAGEHHGSYVHGLRLGLRPARRPAAGLLSLPAPLGTIDPVAPARSLAGSSPGH